MPEFPRSPVSPAELLESYLPAALEAAPSVDRIGDVSVSLGVQLVGEGGGQWVLDLDGGAVRVRAGSRAQAAFSYVQTVDDWRGALWEGRGGAIGRGAAALFRPGAPEVEAAFGLVGAGIPGPTSPNAASTSGAPGRNSAAAARPTAPPRPSQSAPRQSSTVCT